MGTRSLPCSRILWKSRCGSGGRKKEWGWVLSGGKNQKVLVWVSLVAQTVKNPPAMQETWVQSLGQEDPLEKGMPTHSSILAWRIPWTEEAGRLYNSGGHEESDVTETKHTNKFSRKTHRIIPKCQATSHENS